MNNDFRQTDTSSPIPTPTSDREHFDPDELRDVLTHYALGSIESARAYPRGSRKSPKILLETANGRYLLKRRAAGRDRPARVSFSHTILAHLHEKGFPVPRLIRTRNAGDSKLILEGRVYEVFEYLPGKHYDGTLDETEHAGKTLARLHRALRDFQTAWQPGGEGYHDSQRVRAGLHRIPPVVSSHDSVCGLEAELFRLVHDLRESYDLAAHAVNQLGFPKWERWLVHGDWHPGNLRFQGGKVCAVLDFDSARRYPIVADLANGLLQFSMLRSEGQPEEWPEFFDQARMKRFYKGYVHRIRLAAPQPRAVPHLMIESLIAEGVVPVAATGSLGQIPGFGVLRMVLRKAHWIRENARMLESWLME